MMLRIASMFIGIQTINKKKIYDHIRIMYALLKVFNYYNYFKVSIEFFVYTTQPTRNRIRDLRCTTIMLRMILNCFV